MNIIYPSRCPGCDSVIGYSSTSLICDDCKTKIKLIYQPHCLKCGKQLDYFEDEYCEDCSKRIHFYERGIAAFEYSDTMKKSMYAFKYNGRREYATFYAQSVVDQFGHIINSFNADYLMPVPLHAAKLNKRGYNQAQDFAEELSKLLKIPMSTALVRTKNTRPMKEMSDKGRADNIKNAFKLKREDMKGKKIILVDDIYTTGMTMDECAKVLLDAGVASVYFITVCIGRGF